MRRIIWDMDGVLVNLDKSLIKKANELAGKELCDPDVGPDNWYIESIYGDDVTKAAFDDYQMWMDAPINPEVFDLFTTKMDESVICSAPINGISASAKYDYVEALGVPLKKLILAMDKTPLASEGAILVDDNPANCSKFIQAGGKAILFVRRWSFGSHFSEADKALASEHKAENVSELRALLGKL